MVGSTRGPGRERRSGPHPAEVAGVGLQFAAAIVLFLLVGQWLDARLGTAPWLLLLGVMTGAAAGFYSLYRQLVVKPRERQRGDGEEGAER